MGGATARAPPEAFGAADSRRGPRTSDSLSPPPPREGGGGRVVVCERSREGPARHGISMARFVGPRLVSRLVSAGPSLPLLGTYGSGARNWRYGGGAKKPSSGGPTHLFIRGRAPRRRWSKGTFSGSGLSSYTGPLGTRFGTWSSSCFQTTTPTRPRRGNSGCYNTRAASGGGSGGSGSLSSSRRS